ncbi:hypothetical protein ABK040_005753 [Willaertia magna]
MKQSKNSVLNFLKTCSFSGQKRFYHPRLYNFYANEEMSTEQQQTTEQPQQQPIKFTHIEEDNEKSSPALEWDRERERKNNKELYERLGGMDWREIPSEEEEKSVYSSLYHKIEDFYGKPGKKY